MRSATLRVSAAILVTLALAVAPALPASATPAADASAPTTGWLAKVGSWFPWALRLADRTACSEVATDPALDGPSAFDQEDTVPDLDPNQPHLSEASDGETAPDLDPDG